MSLSHAQHELYDGPCPHVSLAKPDGWQWEDLGVWVHAQMQLTDFVTIYVDPRTLYSRKGDVYKTTFTSTALVRRTVELIPSEGLTHHGSTNNYRHG